jgi:uncharacterized protein YjbJ (UPF0337 family)
MESAFDKHHLARVENNKPPPKSANSIFKGRNMMNWETMKGSWSQFKGKIKETWGNLTDDDLDRVAGKRDQLLGAIQKRYGIAKEEAERQIRDFERTCGCS